MSEPALRALCVTSHPDRPETETFIGLRAAGIDLHVRCAPDALQLGRLQTAGVPVEPLRFERKLDRAAIASIRADLDALQPDILHLFDNRTVFNGLIAARGRRVRIITYRGIVGNVSYLSPMSWMRYLNPRVDRIVCVAEAVRQYFLDMHLLWIRLPPEKVVTIHKGHDLGWYRDRPVDRAGLGIPDAAFVVGCVANWRPRKGVEVLIEACRALPPDAPIHLLLVGNMENPDLQAKIDSSPYRDRIHVLGFRKDAPAVIAACDAAVLPSVKREGLPKTVIEAMAYGVPPVVTDCGGSPELVVDGVSGFVVPVRDPEALAGAINELYADAELRARLGQGARERIASTFRIEDTVARTLELYRDLVPVRAALSR